MAEGIKRIAKAYFARANEEEKNEAREYIKKLDLNGDGEISLAKYKKVLKDEEFFKKLYSNGDGALYFPDALVLFYHCNKRAISIHKCDGCGERLLDPYFTCFQCLPKYPKTFDLCCACYRGGEFKHDHPLTDFVHDQAAYANFIRWTQTQAKSGMDGIRSIASAYYDSSSEEEKKKAEAYFEKFNSNRDGKISLTEYNKNVSPKMLKGKEVFNKLDSNGDGALDFSDVLVPFYRNERAIMFYFCDVCSKILSDPYFSCYQCLCELSTTYDLCCDCYRGGKFKHNHHPSSSLMHDKAAHYKFLRHTKAKAKEVQAKEVRHTKAKAKENEMEQLREIAKAYYRAGSPKVQKLANEFFNSMDSDGDGQVDLSEFWSFLTQQGYLHMRDPRFFKELCKDDKETLDIWGVMTLYYIIKSGRPFCDCCEKIIPGIFFSCVECYKGNLESSFNLCLRCYLSADRKREHNHNQFLDNYTLLQATRDSALGQAAGVTIQHKPMKEEATSSSKSQAIVLPHARKKTDMDAALKALQALETAITIGIGISTTCSIL